AAFGSGFGECRVLRRDVDPAELLDQLGVAVRLAWQRIDRELEPAEARGEGGQETDGAGAEDAGAARLPDLEAALDLVGVVDPLLDDGSRLEQDAHLGEGRGEREDVLVVL